MVIRWDMKNLSRSVTGSYGVSPHPDTKVMCTMVLALFGSRNPVELCLVLTGHSRKMYKKYRLIGYPHNFQFVPKY